MSIPKDKVKPGFNFTHPSERDYFDASKSTIDKLQATDPAKTGGDYGIVDAPVVEPIATGKKSETGNGA